VHNTPRIRCRPHTLRVELSVTSGALPPVSRITKDKRKLVTNFVVLEFYWSLIDEIMITEILGGFLITIMSQVSDCQINMMMFNFKAESTNINIVP